MIKKEHIWEVLGYIAIAAALIGQIIIGENFLLGQGGFLIANIINTLRCFVIKQNMADKVRNVCFLAVTIGLMAVHLWSR